MKKPSRKMLDKWAKHINDRRVIESFHEWVEDNWDRKLLGNMCVAQRLDVYHGIDQKQLERERRALLESIRPC